MSELVKLIIIIVLARYFSELRSERLDLVDLAKVAILVGVPLALILKQPDLGTALVLVPLTAVGAFLAGLQWKHAAALAAGSDDGAGGLALPQAIPAGPG